MNLEIHENVKLHSFGPLPRKLLFCFISTYLSHNCSSVLRWSKSSNISFKYIKCLFTLSCSLEKSWRNYLSLNYTFATNFIASSKQTNKKIVYYKWCKMQTMYDILPKVDWKNSISSWMQYSAIPCCHAISSWNSWLNSHYIFDKEPFTTTENRQPYQIRF